MVEKIQIRDARNGGWFWANKLVLDHPYIQSTTKLVYLALAYFANNNTQKSYPSIEKISKLLGLSRPTVIGAIKSLEEYHFIKSKKTQGKVSEYRLLKIIDERPVKKFNQLKKEGDQLKKDTGPVKNKHTNNTNTIILNNNSKDKSLLTGKEVNDLIDLFKSVNPSWERLFAIKTQRKSIENLVKKHGKEKVEKIIKFLPKIVSKPYAPRITTPWLLENKLGDLLIFVKQEQNRSKKSGVAIL